MEIPKQSKLYEKVVSSAKIKENNFHSTSDDESGLPQEPEDEQWTTIERRRAHSPGRRKNSPEKPLKKTAGVLTQDQTQTVEHAVNQLTQHEKRTIARRQKSMDAHRETSLSSQGEGNSKQKGKTIDPREWGNVNLSRESLDLEAQAVALESFAHQKIIPTRRVSAKQPSNVCSPSPRLPAESRPVAQVAKSSYLGMALQNIGRETERYKYRGRNSPSPSDSDSSDESYVSPSDEGDPSLGEKSRSAPPSEQRPRRRDNQHGHGKK